MAEKKTQKKTTTKKTSSKKIKLTFKPIASGAKELNLVLKTPTTEEKDGRTVQVTAPLIEGLPEILTVKKDEILEVTKKQCDELEQLGFVQRRIQSKNGFCR